MRGWGNRGTGGSKALLPGGRLLFDCDGLYFPAVLPSLVPSLASLPCVRVMAQTPTFVHLYPLLAMVAPLSSIDIFFFKSSGPSGHPLSFKSRNCKRSWRYFRIKERRDIHFFRCAFGDGFGEEEASVALQQCFNGAANKVAQGVRPYQGQVPTQARVVGVPQLGLRGTRHTIRLFCDVCQPPHAAGKGMKRLGSGRERRWAGRSTHAFLANGQQMMFVCSHLECRLRARPLVRLEPKAANFQTLQAAGVVGDE